MEEIVFDERSLVVPVINLVLHLPLISLGVFSVKLGIHDFVGAVEKQPADRAVKLFCGIVGFDLPPDPIFISIGINDFFIELNAGKKGFPTARGTATFPFVVT